MKLSDFYDPREYRALVRLGLPITVGQIGMTIQGLADTMMVGQHATAELAAAGFVNNLFTLAILLSMGYSMGAVSQIGAYHAQGRRSTMLSLFKASLVADTLQCLCIVAAMIGLYAALPYLGQPAELLPLMRPYFIILLVSLPTVTLGGAFKQFFDSMGDTWVSMIITLIGNIWNVVFNALWIFGLCGFPELGIVGAAWATLTARVVMLLLYVGFFLLHKKYQIYRVLWRTETMQRMHIGVLNRLGWPIAIQLGMETASFSLCAILLGWVGTTALAAHQVMLNVAMIIYLFYIGVGSAVTIRVSNYHGLSDRLGERRAAHSGYQLILLVGIVASSIVFYFRYHLAALFTDNAEVTETVALMAWPLILYQLGDGMQTNYVSALRGLGDVKPLVRYSFIAYIVVSLPLSYLFGIVFQWGAFGIWMGFPFGLTLAGILYLRRFVSHYRNVV
jgi:MATE family multidrug resistance protein